VLVCRRNFDILEDESDFCEAARDDTGEVGEVGDWSKGRFEAEALLSARGLGLTWGVALDSSRGDLNLGLSTLSMLNLGLSTLSMLGEGGRLGNRSRMGLSGPDLLGELLAGVVFVYRSNWERRSQVGGALTAHAEWAIKLHSSQRTAFLLTWCWQTLHKTGLLKVVLINECSLAEGVGGCSNAFRARGGFSRVLKSAFLKNGMSSRGR